jgi:transposase-like protein
MQLVRLGEFFKAVMHCPICKKQHIDEGIWSKRLHLKHLCLHCGHIWELPNYVFGVSELTEDDEKDTV